MPQWQYHKQYNLIQVEARKAKFHTFAVHVFLAFLALSWSFLFIVTEAYYESGLLALRKYGHVTPALSKS